MYQQECGDLAFCQTHAGGEITLNGTVVFEEIGAPAA